MQDTTNGAAASTFLLGDSASVAISKRLRAARFLRDNAMHRAKLLPWLPPCNPTWRTLLEMFIAEHEMVRVCVSDLAHMANVPATTSLRILSTLADKGLLLRHGDAGDGRRIWVSLTPTGHEAVALMLDKVSELR